MLLHEDHRQAVALRFADAPWVESPEPGVVRKLLERDGEEAARADQVRSTRHHFPQLAIAHE